MEKVVTYILVLLLLAVISPLLPFQNIPKSFIVVSGSMEPLIKSGSLAITRPIDSKNLKVGDIIAFTSPNNPKDTILHRIFSIKSTNPFRFSTKGDNNNTTDLWDVTDAGVKGRFQFSVPHIGNLIGFIKSPIGFTLTICLPALYLIISEIYKIKIYINSEINRRVKNKIKKNYPKIIILLLILVFTSVTIFTKNISALYSSTATSSALTFSIGEVIPPESSINIGDNLSRNIRTFNINSIATDNISVSSIRLYYSFNFNSWQLFSETINGSEGNFHFNSPNGDGLYSFESIAIDSSGNIETKEFNYFNNQVKVDTIAPTTNLDNTSLIDHIYSGQDYLTNGNFENGMTGWTVGSSIGDHHIANVGKTSITNLSNDAFILGSETKTINGVDSLFQTVALPASASSTLSFSYRFLSHDTADYDKFTVNLIGTSGSTIFENILNVGNLETSIFDFDTGWQTLSRNINYLAGQTFKLLFTLIDTCVGDSYNSYVYLDNIKLSTLDLRIGETDSVSFLTTDLGSYIVTTLPDITLNSGENNLNFSSTDSSKNVENPNHQSILVLSPIVLNKIDKNTISIFNNHQSDNIDLNVYSINTGTTLIPLTGTIFSQHSLDIFLSTTLPDSCQIKLFKNIDIVDSTTISGLGNANWQRQGDGLGPWVKINTPVTFNLESRLSVSKITLTVSGLATTLPDMHYTIDYSDASGPQQIYGQILSNTIDINGTSARDFYLGTCSTGGTCLPSLGLGTSFVLTFNGLAKTFNF